MIIHPDDFWKDPLLATAVQGQQDRFARVAENKSFKEARRICLEAADPRYRRAYAIDARFTNFCIDIAPYGRGCTPLEILFDAYAYEAAVQSTKSALETLIDAYAPAHPF